MLSEQTNFLDTLQIPKLSDDECLLCEGELTENELYNALKNMPNNKSPGNDRLTKEFFLTFWDDIKDIYLSSIRTADIKTEFSISKKKICCSLVSSNKPFLIITSNGHTFVYTVSQKMYLFEANLKLLMLNSTT